MKKRISRFDIVAFVFLFIISTYCFSDDSLTPDQRSQYQKYLSDTLKSIELMRGKNGLVSDGAYIDQSSGHCQLKVDNPQTSPTNIALDIINQLDLLQNPEMSSKASSVLTGIMTTLKNIDKDPDSGLFYGWYSTVDSKPTKKNLSSVDNLHLALALWTAQKVSPKSDFGIKAAEILKNMNFSVFATKDGLISANLARKPNIKLLKDPRGDYFISQAQYSYLGSEAHSLYALTKPLGLLKPISNETPNVKIDQAQLEVFNGKGGPILKTWDGGTFQLFLPQMLIGEDAFSSGLKESFDNAAALALQESKDKGYPIPALFSAGNQGTGNDKPKYDAKYVGEAGTPELVASTNTGATKVDLDSVAAPYAVMMAATRDPASYASWLKKMESLKSLSKPKKSLYCPGLGFTDGYVVKGAAAHDVVSSMLSLDQGMTALALNHILSADHQNSSSRALETSPDTRKALQKFYSRFQKKFDDEEIDETPSTPTTGRSL